MQAGRVSLRVVEGMVVRAQPCISRRAGRWRHGARCVRRSRGEGRVGACGWVAVFVQGRRESSLPTAPVFSVRPSVENEQG